VSRTAAVAAGALAVLTSALPHLATAGGSEPPASTEPADTEMVDTESSGTDPSDTESEEPALEGSPAFERRLAEVAFALFLSLDLGVESGSYSCTEPPSLEVGEPIVCFTLIGGERVIIAETEVSASSGVFDFVVVSDYAIDLTDTTSTSTSTTTTSSPTTTALPQPVLITTAPQPNPADQALLAYGEQINANATTFADNLISSAEGFVTEVNEYAWDPDTSTVTLDITLSESWGSDFDVGAWIIVRNLAMEFWNRDSPFRAEGTTIRPSLEIVVNDSRYVSSFDLTVEVADQTIAMTDWVEQARAE
jgi:hypothetical protein